MPPSVIWFWASLLFIICSTEASILIPRIVSPDNTCGKTGPGGGINGYTCSPSLPCCSIKGFCGADNAYCLATAGCQSEFGNCTALSGAVVTPDLTCGFTGAGKYGYVCAADKPCCSEKSVFHSARMWRYDADTEMLAVVGVVIVKTIAP